MVKKLLVPVLCVLLGCAGGAAMGSVTAQTWPDNPSAPRWQLECAELNILSLSRANALLRVRADAGWELVSEHGTFFCFKRPAP